MATKSREGVLLPQASVAWLIDNGQSLINRLKPHPESAEYVAWRQKFIFSRLFICLLLAFFVFLVNTIHNIFYIFLYPKQFNEDVAQFLGNPALAEQYRSGTVATTLITVVLLVVGLFGYRKNWGRRHPALLFLSFSWTLTVVGQIIFTFFGFPTTPDVTVFFGQAILVPVHWRLHLFSQLLPISYYAFIYPLLGLTTWGTRSIYNSPIVTQLFLNCLICLVGVYTYERLQRSEFETRRGLQVFLHSVSHDLKTPVMGTSLVLQNLLKQPEDEIKVKRLILERMQQGSDRQLSLINSLLEAHTSEVQGITLNCQPIHLSTITESLLSDIAPVLQKNQVLLNNSISNDLPLVNADATQLWRVFGNLISNAMKHNPQGITLTLSAKVVDTGVSGIGHRVKGMGKTHTHHQSPHQWVVCTVCDNGVGIPPAQQERLFELYTRGSRARYMPGLGLGLYLCKQIINAHGGEIGVHSNLGEGATFWFTLPVLASLPIRNADTP